MSQEESKDGVWSASAGKTHNSGAADPKIEIPKLTGKNYLNWKSIMSDLIALRGYEGVVFRHENNPTLNLHAKLMIKSALDDAHLAEVRNYDLAHEMWSHLSRMCIGTNSSDVAMLVRKFYTYQHQAGDNMSTHLEKLTTMREQLKDVEQTPTDEVFMDRILQTLPSSYDRLRENWDFMHSSQKTVKELKTRILAIEEKNRHSMAEIDQQAFVVNQFKRMSIQERKKHTNCAKCGLKGHWARECETRTEDYARQPQKPNQRKGQTAYHQQTDSKVDHVFIVDHNQESMMDGQSASADVNLISELVDTAFKVSTTGCDLKNKWIADSGATAHICNNASWFTELKVYEKARSLTVGDNRVTQLKGVGKVEIISKVGNHELKISVENVLLVPELATNLISIGQLDAKGFVTTFKRGHIYLKKQSMNIAHGVKLTNNLWLMDIETARQRNETALLTIANRSFDEWHRTLGHASKPRVQKAIQHHGLKVRKDGNEEPDCLDCPPGKAKHSSHPSLNRRATEVGGRVFVDLAGPIGTSFHGYNYFLLCKDEFSTYTYTYCIQDKSHTCLALAKLFAEFEVETGCRIKRIHSDKGSEFYGNNKVELLLAVEHAVHETSAGYTPQQNGMVEREIQSVTQMARTMLLSSNVPRILWDEAIKTANFIRNRLPNSIVGSSPYEVVRKSLPNIAHLCEFGREVHVVTDDQYLKKFDPRTEEGYVVGFTMRSNTYRVYLKHRKRIIETCNVIFKAHRPEQKPGKEWPTDSLTTDLPPITAKTPLEIYFEDLQAKGWEIESSFEDAQQCDVQCQGELPGNTSQGQYNENTDQQASDEEIESPPFSPLSNNDSTSTEDQEETHQAMVVLASEIQIPKSFKEAINGSNKSSWMKAIHSELEAHNRNGTWIVVDCPSNRALMTTKWIFSVKINDEDGTIERFKGRLVARGFEQRAGSDYNEHELFAPVAKYETIRALIAIAAQHELVIRQFDVTTAFLNGIIEEDVYINPPEGLDVEEGKALKLIKGLYGLKQAPRCWNNEFKKQMEHMGFEATKSDHCLFKHKSSLIYLCLYVDDGLILAKDEQDLDKIIASLKEAFDVRVIMNSTFVGLKIQRTSDGYAIHQKAYAKVMLEKFGLQDSKPVSAPLITSHKLTEPNKDDKDANCPYREAIGSLLYLATKTRPDILHGTTMLAKFCEKPQEKHWSAIKRIMKYINGTSDMCLVYGKVAEPVLDVYCDADWASDAQNRRSITGTIITYAKGPVIFRSSQQSLIALSTTEAEFVAAAESIRDLIWLTSLFKELEIEHKQPQLKCDSQTAIRLIRNPEFPRRTKHIDIKYQFIRDHLGKKEFDVTYISSEEQIADFLTKALARDQFKTLITYAGIKQPGGNMRTSERGGVLACKSRRSSSSGASD